MLNKFDSIRTISYNPSMREVRAVFNELAASAVGMAFALPAYVAGAKLASCFLVASGLLATPVLTPIGVGAIVAYYAAKIGYRGTMSLLEDRSRSSGRIALAPRRT